MFGAACRWLLPRAGTTLSLGRRAATQRCGALVLVCTACSRATCATAQAVTSSHGAVTGQGSSSPVAAPCLGNPAACAGPRSLPAATCPKRDDGAGPCTVACAPLWCGAHFVNMCGWMATCEDTPCARAVRRAHCLQVYSAVARPLIGALLLLRHGPMTQRGPHP